MSSQPQTLHGDDLKVLHSMAYAQELARNMKGFQNFTISFSIICILSGGINSLGQGIGGLAIEAGAARLVQLLTAARTRQLTGVGLKDEHDDAAPTVGSSDVSSNFLLAAPG